MRKRINWFGAAVLVLLGILLPSGGAEAAAKYYASRAADYPMEVNGAVYEAEQKKFDDGYFAQITRTKDGKKTVLVPKADFAYVTNDVYLYYAKPGKVVNDPDFGTSHKNTIYRLTIKTGGKKKIVSGLRTIPAHAVGNYLFYGRDDYADGITLYSYDVKKKKKTFMVDVVGAVKLGTNRVITDTNTGDVDNYPIYSFNFNGSDKRKITEGVLLKVSGKKMYFAKVKFVNGYERYRVYSCNLLGRGKTARTGWVKQIPKKYFD